MCQLWTSSCLEDHFLEQQVWVDVILGWFDWSCVVLDSQGFIFVKASPLNIQKMVLFLFFLPEVYSLLCVEIFRDKATVGPWIEGPPVCCQILCVAAHSTVVLLQGRALQALFYVFFLPPPSPPQYGQNNTLFSLTAFLERAELFWLK